ncbi:MAG TPA: aminoglycoside phosphotransferase family protein, partial [Bdellovibrionota bacterium]|nr:aminoglycoside phosphotransferase family protein [Bdellovibrionota bacterium]
SLGSRPFLIQRFLPGGDAEDLWSGFSAESKLEFLARFGQEVGRLHSIQAARFTEGNPPAGQDRSWEAHVKDRLEKLVRYNRKASVLAFEELSSATTRIVGYLSASAAQVSPALVHRDLCLRNALADPSGNFAALLDFEHARLSDPLMDFVKLRMWVFEAYPGSEEPFMRGYRRLRPAPWPHERERLALCEGLELLGEIPYYHRAGNEPWLMQAVDRLRAWLVAPVSSR